jgi:hypothetical protein
VTPPNAFTTAGVGPARRFRSGAKSGRGGPATLTRGTVVVRILSALRQSRFLRRSQSSSIPAQGRQRRTTCERGRQRAGALGSHSSRAVGGH